MRREYTIVEFEAGLAQALRSAHVLPRQLARHDFANLDAAHFESSMRRMQGVCSSMTAWEREHPDELTASRRRRIAIGAGVSVVEVSQTMRQFQSSREIMAGPSKDRQLRPVLGLVTHDPARRDPSGLGPETPGQRGEVLRVMLVAATIVLILIAAFGGV